MVGFLDKIRNWLKTGDTQQSVNKTCHDPAKDLVECISTTECFESGRDLHDCAKNDDESGNRCKKQITEYYLCRKFSVNHLKHFVKDSYK
ncbi:hypothetical protein SteCoe_23201 [Stentor coeruleus]|uniref:CHCH domain-containing protein n=1 Tax=Stentor coeruleus TaxID=5963 RepID=A0A1R2BKF4_9CILI|nr:hypothetical protein SteCoe_23201 [Stentor coeruleus]